MNSSGDKQGPAEEEQLRAAREPGVEPFVYATTARVEKDNCGSSIVMRFRNIGPGLAFEV
jgi:hypothetical protein